MSTMRDDEGLRREGEAQKGVLELYVHNRINILLVVDPA